MMRRIAILAVIAVSLLSFSCTKEDERKVRTAGSLVPVDLSLSLEAAPSSVESKAFTSIVTEIDTVPNFRGVDDIRVLPFDTRDAIVGTDVACGHPNGLPSISSLIDERAYSGSTYHTGLVRNNHSHFYPDAYAAFPNGTASVLIYGKAPTLVQGKEAETKHINGSLIETGWDESEQMRAASEITFSPDPIVTTATVGTATSLAQILSYVATSATYAQDYYYHRNGVWYSSRAYIQWNGEIEDLALRSYFDWFTSGGQLMTGAGHNLEYLLTTLYSRLLDYESDNTELYYHMAGGIEYPAVLTEGDETSTFTNAVLYEGLRDVLLQRIRNLVDGGLLNMDNEGKIRFRDADERGYPSNLGLPEGAAVLRWNGLRFVVVKEGLDGIAALDRFCYMPSLYYFTNSTVSTASSNNIYENYTAEKTSWSQILSAYRQGKVITKGTRAVAIDNPLQYACALLAVTVKASVPNLPDADGDIRTYCQASGTNFPVTGIIVGSQFRQNFDFTPDESADEYYLYDNQVSGVYLTTSESKQVRTLVLPVPVDTDIYFFLELRNDSGAAFTGAEGVILPGSKFYLAGLLEHSSDPAFPRVFMQDHLTTARCIVSSMENAHVAVPEMGEAQLILGVRCKLNWIMSTSAYVVLE